ncbi:MAG TPA: hypothetical protein VLB82_13700 [Thermodesulfobacteriota bacterium]|nr:hypothetical protein [Thermodesulfobacteriota bacterium]
MARFLLFLSVLLVGAGFSYAEQVKVLSSVNAIREECKFFSPVKAKVNYNDELSILDKKGDWNWVSFLDVQGCIHNSAITERKVALTNLDTSSDDIVSYNEVSLAGKGFFQELYTFTNPNAKFGTLEAIESFEVTEQQLAEFAQEGSLHLP